MRLLSVTGELLSEEESLAIRQEQERLEHIRSRKSSFWRELYLLLFDRKCFFRERKEAQEAAIDWD